MLQYEATFYWAGVTAYALAAAIYLFSLTFNKERWLSAGALLTSIGLLPHGIAILIRWFAVGHGPYMSSYEVISSNSWLALVAFLAVQSRIPRSKLVGALVLPLSVIAMGVGFYLSSEAKYLTPALRGYWLFIHIFFAKLAYSSILVGLGFAVLLLLRSTDWGREKELLSRLPSDERLDELSYRFTAVGFLFLAVMIVAGSIWANQAWGRYWGWDPTETWSLITWLTYGIYLHARITYNWRGKRSAWTLIFAMFVLVFSFFALPYLPISTIHGPYFRRGAGT